MSANKETIAQWIREKKTALGIEFGSTRIKAVLVGEDHTPIASGAHDWENRLTDGIWTYTLEDLEWHPECIHKAGRGCKEPVWRNTAYSRRHRHQCHDAWLYGIR